mgnify:CR=1 FL=1
MVGGLIGSTKGLRFNPRESAEELEEDSAMGREDSEERAKHDAKKIEEQNKRAHSLQGLQHMKIKIPQNHEDDEEDSDVKQQAEVGQLTGQVGQSEAMDGANPKASGMGSNILLSDSIAFIDDAFEMIRKKKYEPKFDTDKPKKTTDVHTKLSQQRGKKGKIKRRLHDKDTEHFKTDRGGKGKKGKPLKPGYVRQTHQMTGLGAGQAPYRSFGMMGSGGSRYANAPIRVTNSTGRSQSRAGYENPQKKVAQDLRQALRQNTPTQDNAPSIPTMTTESRKVRANRGSRQSRPHTKALRQPRTTITPGGASINEHTSLAGGRASAMAAGGIGSSDSILASEEFLNKRATKVNLGISPRDKIEYQHLVTQLNHLLRRLMRKGDASFDAAPEGPTPNAHPRMTSHPRGPTEVDPDDDPTMWGTHAYGLYTRRGGIS